MKQRIEHAPPLCASASLRGKTLYHWIAAEVAAAAVAAEITTPDGIELLDKRFNKCWVIGQNAVLEVALFLGLRSHSSAGEIRRTEIRLYTINNDTLEMYSRAKHSLGLLQPLRGSFASLIRPT